MPTPNCPSPVALADPLDDCPPDLVWVCRILENVASAREMRGHAVVFRTDGTWHKHAYGREHWVAAKLR